METEATELVSRLCECGYEAYIVGGATRDMLLGKEPDDEDVVTNATPEEINYLFSKDYKVSEVGASFNVSIVDGIEIGTYRIDRNYGAIGKDKCVVETCETLLEDLSRRDFTINSIATCPYTGEFIDPFLGQSDLRKGIIKFVGDPELRIKEDPCRILRACRMITLIEGKFDIDTLQALIYHSDMIKDIAPERIRLEILKSMKYKRPSIFFESLYMIGGLDYVLPELNTTIDHTGGQFHNESVWDHLMICGDNIRRSKQLGDLRSLTRLTGYLHDIGKPYAYTLNGDNFVSHEKYGADILKECLSRLKFSTEEITYIKNLTICHMRSITNNARGKTVRRLINKLSEKNIPYMEWIRHKIADKKANLKSDPYTLTIIRNMINKIEKQLISKAPFTVNSLDINGHDIMEALNIKGGPKVGEVKRYLFEIVLDNPEMNNNETLINFIKDDFYVGT